MKHRILRELLLAPDMNDAVLLKKMSVKNEKTKTRQTDSIYFEEFKLVSNTSLSLIPKMSRTLLLCNQTAMDTITLTLAVQQDMCIPPCISLLPAESDRKFALPSAMSMC